MSASHPVALTELRGDDGNVVPGVLFSVKLPEDEDWPVAWMDVEHSVHVCASINRVPAQNTHTDIGFKPMRSGFMEVCRIPWVRDTGNSHIYRVSQVWTGVKMVTFTGESELNWQSAWLEGFRQAGGTQNKSH